MRGYRLHKLLRVMKLLVCGGRKYADADAVVWHIAQLGPDELCHGACRGADQLAGDAARLLGIPCRQFPANWALYGPKAGYIRNSQMRAEFKPDKVLGFPGGTGTKMMCTLAERAGVEVVQVV